MRSLAIGVLVVSGVAQALALVLPASATAAGTHGTTLPSEGTSWERRRANLQPAPRRRVLRAGIDTGDEAPRQRQAVEIGAAAPAAPTEYTPIG